MTMTDKLDQRTELENTREENARYLPQIMEVICPCCGVECSFQDGVGFFQQHDKGFDNDC